MKSTMRWIVKSSLALALVAGLSVMGTIPAHAIAIYESSIISTLQWDAQDGINFSIQPGEVVAIDNVTGDGVGTSDSGGSTPFGPGFLSLNLDATGQAITPNVWASSGASGIHSVDVTNNSDLAQEVEFSASFLWNIQGMTNPPPLTVETAFAAADLAYFTGDAVTSLFDVSNTAPPPFDQDNDGNQDFVVVINPGQTVRVGLLGRVEGEAHSERGVDPIPEPTSILLLGTGMIGLGAWQWRRNKKNQNVA